MKALRVKKELKKYASPGRKKASMWFFKTEKGQYGYGDVFIGVAVPDQRKVARQFRELSLRETFALLKSKIHEERLTALFILIGHYRMGDERRKKMIVQKYLAHAKWVNNWDLVDSSAPHILGDFLLTRKRRSVLHKFAKSKSLWERRIAIIATQRFIKEGDLKDTMKIAEMLIRDKHDLIRKAVGWMLREAGDKNKKLLVSFLKRHRDMPRVMYRYATEHLRIRV